MPGAPAYLEALFGLEGRVALVTGARQGIGRSLALALAGAGAEVVVSGRSSGDVRLDVNEPASVDAAVAAVIERRGRLDVLVNNAAVPLRKDALDISVDEWDAVLETNLRGTFLMCQAAARVMGEGGRIINVSSTYARRAVARRAAYAASKAGLEQLTRVLALEWAPRGITVNALAPTTVVTESRAELFSDEAVRAARVGEIPLGRLGAAEDLAGAVLLLAGPAGGFITGTTILVDGGYSL